MVHLIIMPCFTTFSLVSIPKRLIWGLKYRFGSLFTKFHFSFFKKLHGSIEVFHSLRTYFICTLSVDLWPIRGFCRNKFTNRFLLVFSTHAMKTYKICLLGKKPHKLLFMPLFTRFYASFLKSNTSNLLK